MLNFIITLMLNFTLKILGFRVRDIQTQIQNSVTLKQTLSEFMN